VDYESTLNQALDLKADGEDRKADRLLQNIIDHAKARISGSDDDLERHYFWGRALTAMEEPEQALLRFEKALQIDPEHEGTVWETASIFLHELDRPDSARTLLAERLLPMSPDNALYRESLVAAEFALKLRKNPPGNGPAGKEPPSAAKAAANPRLSDHEREAALQREADALLKEAGDWEPEDAEI
jgi:tetratricopeptide (TPR) repeat protein